MKRYLFVTLFIFCCSLVYGQHGQPYNNNLRYTSLGINLNAMNYAGEVDPAANIISPALRFTGPAIGTHIQRKVTPRVSLRGCMSWGRIKGSDVKNTSYKVPDIYRKIRNLSFRNDLWEVKADIMVDLFKNRRSFLRRNNYVPYAFAGLAYFHHNPKAKSPAEFGRSWIALQPLALEGISYSRNQLSIPIGLGARYKLGKQWELCFEMGWRFTFTDFLDDISGNYRSAENFKNNELAKAMHDRSMEGIRQDPELQDWLEDHNGFKNADGYITPNGWGRSGDQRGNPSGKDLYIVTGFHLNYIIFKEICPKFR